jgi:predicted  nucleic acid-binding Zn-ribbon protein
VNCRYCGEVLPVGSSPRREFCSDAHKQAYWRMQHKADQAAVLLAEVEQLRAIVREQVQTIDEQAAELARLHNQLDVERRYLSDTKPHGFKTWLKKQPASSLREKLLTDDLVLPRGSRAYYEAHLRRLGCSTDELADFTRLWKLMLLQP